MDTMILMGAVRQVKRIMSGEVMHTLCGETLT